MTSLTRLALKNVTFLWSDECEESFLKFKTLLMSTPFLNLPLDVAGFTMYCDCKSWPWWCVHAKKKGDSLYFEVNEYP